jgi:aspartate/methionine/tyrosine aminotransferase
MMLAYRRRRDIIVDGLNQIKGVKCLKPGGAFYVFPNITGTGLSSEEFSSLILHKAGVAACPGNYFGEAGEGYVRFCFANSEENIQKAIQRIKKVINPL